MKIKTNSSIEHVASNARDKFFKYYRKINEMAMSVSAIDPYFKLAYCQD
jgi:hypothetical protein